MHPLAYRRMGSITGSGSLPADASRRFLTRGSAVERSLRGAAETEPDPVPGVDLRCVKTTLRMETLSCCTPAMAMKELCVHLLAYNFVRGLMLRAALHVGV